MLHHFSELSLFNDQLISLSESKMLINTLNAHSFNIAQTDEDYAKSLISCDVLLPDGISVVYAMRLLYGKQFEKIAGADLFFYEMNRLNKIRGKCFFLGSNVETLKRISIQAKKHYPHVKVASYSPPYKAEFNNWDNQQMLTEINTYKPDVLFIGMTAPKQEKWAYKHFQKLEVGHVCNIGAVFDFFAGTVSRSPQWMIRAGFEWLYRLLREPRRMWRRYIIGNTKFVYYVFKEFVYYNFYQSS